MNNENRFEEQKTRAPLRSALTMTFELPPWQACLIGVVLMLALILVVVRFNIPNPNMILVAGLVISAALFGYQGGLLSAALMLLYAMYYFSTDHDFITFTTVNFEELVVVFIGMTVVLLFVCELKRNSLRAFREVDALTQTLQEDNMLLKELSLSDALTGIRNRLALRHDFNSYIGRDVYVLMMDVDDFKNINDRYGHGEGDRVLRMTGKNLADQFGQGYCYRYGGDEFMIICPDVGETELRRRIKAVFELSPPLDKARPDIRAQYSVGYVAGRAADDHELRRLFSKADERMYIAKRAGKNQIEGGPVRT